MAEEQDNKTPDTEASETTEAMDVQPDDTKAETPADEKAKETETKDAKSADAESADAEADDAKPKGEKPKAEKSKDGKPKRSRRRGASRSGAKRDEAKPRRQAAEPILGEDGQPILVKATSKYVRTSARKARLVIDNIRGQSVPKARVTLAFIPRRAAKDVAKVLESAVANAEHNHDLDADDLYVTVAFADEGPTFKRWQPRARGRATQILKRTAHITVIVSPTPAHLLEKTRKAAA